MLNLMVPTPTVRSISTIYYFLWRVRNHYGSALSSKRQMEKKKTAIIPRLKRRPLKIRTNTQPRLSERQSGIQRLAPTETVSATCGSEYQLRYQMPGKKRCCISVKFAKEDLLDLVRRFSDCSYHGMRKSEISLPSHRAGRALKLN